MKAIASTSDWLALSLTDAAGSLSVSPSALKRLIAAGQLRTSPRPASAGGAKRQIGAASPADG